jgi:hypothetical protein
VTAKIPLGSARGDHWLRALLYGLLAEFATILTIVLVVTLYRFLIARGLSVEEYTAFSERTGAVVGPIAGVIYTFIFAGLLMRRVSRDWVAHGVVVAVGAIALSIGGSLAGHHTVPAAYLLASALKLAAGALAGLLAARRGPANPEGATRLS